MRNVLRAAFVVLALDVAGARAHAGCDAAGVDAAAVTAGRAAIDDACPCAAALGRAAYRRCATLAVRIRVAASQLSTACRRDVLRHAKLSVCGRPGAVVCCRVRADGRTRHGVVPDPAACVDTATFTSCVSAWQSVPLGCDAAGCVPPPVCGDGAVNAAGEECDPPDQLYCDLACHRIACDPPPTSCGNGVVDAGEACEPPGADDCTSDCQLATCPTPPPGVVAIACMPALAPSYSTSGTTFAAGTLADGYVIGWSGAYRRAEPDILARRFDADLAPIDAGVTLVSEGLPCASGHGSPSIASDGGQYFVAWSSYGTFSDGGPGFQAIDTRRLGGIAGTQAVDDLAFNVPVGFCRTDIGGPTIAQRISSDRFAVGFNSYYTCLGQSGFLQNPVGSIVDYDPGAVVPPVSLGFPIGPPPGAYSASGATVAELGGDVLWAWHALYAVTFSDVMNVIAVVWTDASGSTAATTLTTRGEYVETPPSAAAGTASFLVAWGQGVGSGATRATEIRVLRTTRTGGNLDPDGGVLVATAVNEITNGPVVGFDGSRWLVLWTERMGPNPYSYTWDLRAVAVAEDGTLLDASPRLVASNVSTIAPATASRGDGKVLVVYGELAGSGTAVRATLVAP